MSDTPTGMTVRPRGFSLLPQSLGEAKELAAIISKSGLAPKDYIDAPDKILVAIQMGADLGLKPMQSLQNIAVINGRPSIWGDAAAALVQSSGLLERFHETFEGTFPEDTFTAVCVLKRKDWPDEIRREFSIADAKTAKLWGKTGREGQPTPWITYPKRMLQMRARGFALRDAASDMLMGLILAEEAQDIPSIDAHVISAETLPPAGVSLLANVPEAMRENIGKAFAELKMSTPQADGTWQPTGLGLTKLNEFLAGDGVDPEAGATALLEWCKDEWAKRKTGQPRKKAEGNGKAKKEGKAEGAVADAAAAGHANAVSPGTAAAGTDHPAAIETKATSTSAPAPEAKADEPKAPVADEPALF